MTPESPPRIYKDADRLIKQLEDKGFQLTREGSFTEFLGIKLEQTDTRRNQTYPEGTGSTRSSTPPVYTIASRTAYHNLSSHLEATKMVHPCQNPGATQASLACYCTFPPTVDLTLHFAVSQICRFNSKPKQSHASAVKTIVRLPCRNTRRRNDSSPNKQNVSRSLC